MIRYTTFVRMGQNTIKETQQNKTELNEMIKGLKKLGYPYMVCTWGDVSESEITWNGEKFVFANTMKF